MASEQSSSGLALHEMTPAIISSGLVPKPTSSTPVDHSAPEVIALIAEVVAPEHVGLTSSPSSTIVDQDAPSPSKSQSTPETQPPVITTMLKKVDICERKREKDKIESKPDKNGKRGKARKIQKQLQ
nr:hypothetical protein [Tanacetum cinerariifolium]